MLTVYKNKLLLGNLRIEYKKNNNNKKNGC